MIKEMDNCNFFFSQAIRPVEFTYMNDRISLGFVDATIMKPMVVKGTVCRDLRVFPAECRARKCSYRSKLVVSSNILLVILKGLLGV